MPTSEELLKLQEAITTITDTAEDIQQANAQLIQEIKTVVVHNVDPEAHEDIRAEILRIQNEIPNIISNPEVSGPLTVENGETNVFTFAAVSYLSGSVVDKFKITMPNGTTTTYTDPDVVNQVLTVPLVFTGERFEQQTMIVIAGDSNDNWSAPTIVNLTITNNLPPDLSELICTGIPLYANPGETITFTFSGANDEDIPYGDSLTYSIENTNLSFNKTTGITEGETIEFTVPVGTTRGITEFFTIKGTDEKGSTSVKSFGIKINQLPNLASLTHTLPSLINPNTTFPFILSGVTDADVDQTVKYSISCNNNEISFSKTTDISSFETVYTTVSNNIPTGTTFDITITAYDNYGGQSSYIHAAKINTPPNITDLICNLPPIVKPDTQYTFKISGATDVDNNTIKYSLVCSDLSLVFSKINNIVENEDITVTIPNSVTRGATFSITVTATDELNSSSFKNFLYKINTLVSATNFTIDGLPDIVEPNKTYPVTIGNVSDIDSQPITYSISCDNVGVTFSDNTDIPIAETMNITIPNTVVRNSNLIFTLIFSDGLETVTKNHIVKVNNLPSNVITDTLPTMVKPNTSYPFILASNDDDGQSITYSIVSDNPHITFSKDTNISPNESVNLIVDDTIVRGAEVELTITISDGLESVTTERTVKVNRLPSTELTDTLLGIVIPNSTNACSLSSTDLDGQTLSYSITSDKGYISFSKSSGLAVNESFNIVVASNAVRGETVTFTVTISDGMETSVATFQTFINVLPVVTGLVVNNLPAIAKPDNTYSLNITGATDANHAALYHTIFVNDANVTFSKSTGLTPSESFNMTVGAAITRGTTVTFTIRTSDGLEYVDKTVNMVINNLPVVSALALNNLPTIIKPNSVHTVNLSGATDSNGQTLSYSISSDKAYATFSKSSGLAANEAFDITFSAAAVRGETVTFTVVVSDGLETTNKTFTTIVNSLPIATNIVCNNLPANSSGGVDISINFTGATDVNGQTLNYSISDINSNLTFSKTTGIASGETITLSVAKVSEITIASFTVKATDSLGEISTTSKVFNLTINVVYLMGTPSIIYPTAGQVLPNDNFTMTFSEIDVDIDT